MRIGGLVKQSLLDYPNHIAAVVFTTGCNFRCGYCHNPALVLPQLYSQSDTISAQEVLSFLSSRVGWLDAVVITGGEPTLHSHLPEFIASVKALGYRVKLDTNGTNPMMLQHLVDLGMIDFIAMDIKHELTAEQYSRVIGLTVERTSAMLDSITASIDIIRSSGLPHEFRTVILPNVHTPRDKALMALQLNGTSAYRVTSFREGETVGDYILEESTFYA